MKKVSIRKSLGVRELHKLLREARGEVDILPQISLVGDQNDTSEMLNWLGDGAAEIFVPAPPSEPASFSKDTDIVIYVLAGRHDLGPDWREQAERCKSLGLEALALIDGSEMNEAARGAKQVEAELVFDLSPGRVRFYEPQIPAGDDRSLLGFLVDHLNDKEIGLAASVPVFRPLVVAGVIAGIANENGVIGLTSFFPGADMPLLTANQMRMVLRIAGAHGIALSLRRARELLLVLGGGFTLRAAARQVIGLVPVAGWAVKGAIAYSGTQTVGILAHKYFEGLKG